jgi:hypothetical protein
MCKISSLIILAMLVSSCSLQKRVYNKGFYASKTHTLKKAEVDTSLSLLSNIKPIKEKKATTPLLVNSKANPVLVKEIYLLNDCDTIMLRSGAKILANITEISPDEIKFRNCNSPNEPVISLKRSNINYIVYTNGRKEIMEDESFKTIPYRAETNDNNNYNKRDKHHKTSDSGKNTNPFSIAGFWLGLFLYPFYIIGLIIYGFYLLSFSGLGTSTVGLAGIASSYLSTALFYIPFIIILAGFILSIVAIYQISQNKESHKGMGLAITAAILCLFAFIFLFVLFI